MLARSDTDARLHRLANYVECQLSELFQMLLADSRSENAREIVYHGCFFVENLRAAVENGGDDE